MIKIARAELARAMRLPGVPGSVTEVALSGMYVSDGVLVIPGVKVLPLHLVGRMDQEADVAVETTPAGAAAGRARKT
jgi:hypothetical protein